ncbi:hypothetical protein [Sphingomonas sp. UBA978]|uniref:hypothetical protein n=1 Tax=Sphingomonas sp. UBA978 TaxID=1947536 RepID=UPI0025F7EABD|nr:hypothetical protein [Sphingomonas sp. UBA978]
MPLFTLTPTDWTEIVPVGGTDDMDVVPRQGQFLVSFNTATDAGATTMVMPPVPPLVREISRQRVAAGVRVYAKAIRDTAAVYVGTAAK